MRRIRVWSSRVTGEAVGLLQLLRLSFGFVFFGEQENERQLRYAVGGERRYF